MSSFFAYTVIGLFTGAAYSIAASGLVLTYNTTRVFNIAHGAFGMVFGFVFWDFSQRQGIPVLWSLILVLFVVAPLTGWFVQRVLANNLGAAPVGVMLVVTVGMLVALIGLATKIWPASTYHSVPLLYPGKMIHLGSVVVSYHELITIALSILIAAGLYLFLNRTRLGSAMRASVDNPELLQLYGGRPQLVSAVAWGIGMSLAALGGILLAPDFYVGLDYYRLTLVVISAFAAALLGKLTSLPMTYLGALALGLTTAYLQGYLPGTSTFAGLRNAVPALFLFAIVILLPQAPLRIGQIKGLKAPRIPSLGKSAAWGAVFLVVTMVLAMSLSDGHLSYFDTALVFGMVMLSLVLLTGYGGYVSLAQFSLAGIGAVAYVRSGEPNLIGVVVAGLATAAIGALIALFVLRLTGLYLALATLAFAQLLDAMIFGLHFAFGSNGELDAQRMSLFGISLKSEGSYTFVMALFFVIIALIVLALRRGPLGRVVIASRDSPAASGTLGLDLRWFRVGLFAISAFIAGIAGALMAGQYRTLGTTQVGGQFYFFQSLLVLLAAVVFGVTTVSGAFLGGLFLMYLPNASTSTQGILFLVLGIGAVALGRDPNGLASRIFDFLPWMKSSGYPALVRRYPGLAFERTSRREDQDDDWDGGSGGDGEVEHVAATS